ncbi:MAG: alkylation response protein AidB-like acyl-CoA dehydrogenase [Myxococcota bacterium]|jgi:alkylation response protein AidB-like acyl-CoA dehydrogenase
MGEFIGDLRDIKFVLFEQLRVQEYLATGPYADFDQETLEMVLDAAFDFATNVLAPLNEPSDRIGAQLVDGRVVMPPGTRKAWKSFGRNGWVGLTADPNYGGQGVPESVGVAATELFTGSCHAFNLTRLLTYGAANLIRSFGTDEMRATYLEKMYSGEWTGTMCLTEAGAGSDVGSARTTATPEGDHYLIEGEKIFITSGDNDMADNIVHAVLARLPGAPAGTRGISLFLVPFFRVRDDGSVGERNNVQALRLEEKMGIHGSPTCVMGFGMDGPCHGYLLGEENAGMREMFQMMNEARLAVGIEGVATANASFNQALAFSRDRIQGRDITRRKEGSVAIVEHPDVRRMLLWQKAYAEGLRALGYLNGACIDRAHVARAAGNKEEAVRQEGLAAVLTPITKAFSTDKGFEVADMALQCYGGYGFTSEYPAEQYVRDSRISRIYEGTNGIQALDLVGRKLKGRGGADVRELLAELKKRSEQVRSAGLGDIAGHIDAGLAAITTVIEGFVTSDNRLTPVLNATDFLGLFGDVVVGTLLGEQAAITAAPLAEACAARNIDVTDAAAVRALAEDNNEARFLYSKQVVARWFAANVLPLAASRARVLLNGDDSAMQIVF